MGVREQYLTILAEDGRRVANRFALASLGNGAERDLSTFYGCYGNEHDLPEDERSRPNNPANAFDPSGWFAFYARNPWIKVALDLMSDNNLADWWDASDMSTRTWMLSLAHKTDDEQRKIAEDLEQRGDQAWADFVYSLTEEDLTVLYLLGNRTRRWPDPNSPAHAGQIAKEYVNRIRSLK